MKVKEVSTTATIAWSPQNVATPHLVCATAAPHADPTNKNDAVQIYSLNLKEENLSMHMEGSFSTTTRFHDVVWGVGGSQVKGGHGVVACAGDNGGIYIYNGEQLTVGGSNPLLTAMEGKHAGPVFTLDFNHHQPNLLASGSQDCEMFIWDINDPGVPMSPGTKATLAADVTSVAWNRQVEHILASAYAGRCVVFDLRKSTSIIQISDALSRMKANTVCWHPSVATQLALASGDDVTPVCQVWDLRFPSAPIRQCEGHQRGLQDLAWCQQDPTLLCTAAKDNRVVFWNPDNGEIVCELPAYNQWSFKVSWCPRDPALVATATVDGSVSVYSLLGGGYPPPTDVKFSAIADSFPGMEMPTEAPATAQPQHIYPRSPPAFFAAKGGCSFGFGGRLVSWHSGSRAVEVSQVVTEPEVVERGNQLLNLLHSADLHQYCADKVASNEEDDAEKEVWQYISAGLHGEASSAHYLTLLGHPPPPFTPTPHQLSPQEEGALSAQMGGLSATGGSTGSLDPSEQFEMIASAQSDKSPEPELVEPDSPVPESHVVVVCSEGDGGDIRQAVVEGRLQDAVERCLGAGKAALALVLAQHAGEELYSKTRDRVLSLESDPSEVCGLVCAVVRGDLHSVVQQCRLAEWRDAVSTVLTHAPQEHVTGLLQHLGNRLEGAGQQQPALLCYLVAGALDAFVQCWAGSRGGLGGISTQHLQDLVEVMLVLQQSGHVATTPPAEGGSAVGSYLARYASILTTQGSLTTALYYLANNAAVDAQPELSALKDRLSHALGHTAGSGATGRPGSGQFRGRTTSSSSSSQLQSAFRRTSTPSASFQPPQFTPSVQARQASAFPPPSTAPPPSGMAQPLHASAQSTPFFQPVQQQTQSYGQPPAMGGHQFGGGYQPVAAPPPPPPPSAALTATVSAPGGLRRPGAVSRYVSHGAPQQQQQPLPPSSMPGFLPYQPATNQQLQQIQQPPPAFLDPGSTSLPPPPPPSASSLPYPPGVDATTTTSPGGEPLKPPAAFDPSVPRGWNDPPPMSATRREGGGLPHTLPCWPEHSGARRLHTIKAKQQQQQVAASITASAEPVAAMVPSQPFQPTQQPSFPPPQQGFQPLQSGFQPSQSSYQPPPTGFQGFQGFQPPSSGPPQATPPVSLQQQQRQHPTPTSTPLPLPAEAQKIYDVLNGLYCRGMQTAPNMNVRQTFESIGPKLEVLYDKLRHSQVGSASLQGLQALCVALEAGDYHRALQLHQQTLTAGSFTDTAAFMPAIKKMINTCMQCQIFLN